MRSRSTFRVANRRVIKGDPRELSPERIRHTAAQRRFAYARRTHEAQNRSLELTDQGLHREIFEDALLDLFESVMVFLEDPLSFLNVELIFGVFEARRR